MILNSASSQPTTVVLDANTSPHTRPPISSTNNTQDVIAFVNPDASSRLQMMYSSSGNAVIYAPHAASAATSLKRNDSGVNTQADVVALQHTPVIQTPSMTQVSSNG